MEIIEKIALISINGTIFVQVLSFLIFLFIMNRLMFRPLSQTMEEREQYIEKVHEDISQAETDLDRVTLALKKREEDVRRAARDAGQKLEENGQAEADRIFEGVRLEIEDIKKETEKDIQAKLNAARKELHSEAETLALRVMEKILDRRISA